MKTLIAFFSFCLLAFSCSQDLDITTPSKKTFFSASLPLTSIKKVQWKKNDTIGVFMYDANTGVRYASNVPYITIKGNGAFYDSPQPLTYPTGGQNVSFWSYYPYSKQVDESSFYTFDFAKDSSVDFLFSDNLKEQSKEEKIREFHFTRPLSVLQVLLKGEEKRPRIIVKGLASKAKYNFSQALFILDDTSSYEVKVETKRDSLVANIPVFPNQDFQKASLVVSLDGRSKQVKIPSKEKFLPGKIVKLTLDIASEEKKDSSVGVKTFRVYRETPLITAKDTIENKYIIHDFYNQEGTRNWAALYSTKYKIAFWVAYPLVSKHFYKVVNRTDDWQYDPFIPERFQANLKKSYPNRLYDRGHQLPSGDRLNSYQDNASTFYYTNMTPQEGKLNRGQWQQLESKVRGWTSGTDTLFVVTGAMPYTKGDSSILWTQDIDNKMIAVPKYYFKALARRVGSNFQTIAFVYLNEEPKDKDYRLHAISVAELEKKTGFTFFPSLAKEVKEKYNISNW